MNGKDNGDAENSRVPSGTPGFFDYLKRLNTPADIAAASLGFVAGGMVDIATHFTLLSVGSAAAFGMVTGVGIKNAVAAALIAKRRPELVEPAAVIPALAAAQSEDLARLVLLQRRIQEQIEEKEKSQPTIGLAPIQRDQDRSLDDLAHKAQRLRALHGLISSSKFTARLDALIDEFENVVSLEDGPGGGIRT